MSLPRLRRLAVVLALLLAGLPGAARAQNPPDWVLTGLTDTTVGTLFGPASGAFFAGTEGGLVRSNDGGQTWAPAITTRPDLTGIAVDPNNHAVVYATGPGGLYRSVDDAQTFTLIYTLITQQTVRALALSPANGNLLYLAVSKPVGVQIQFFRTTDGGTSWQEFGVIDTRGGPCTPQLDLLRAHPTNDQRLFYSAGCYAGRNVFGGHPLGQSMNRGTTMAPLLQVSGRAARGLIGGQGVAPGRLYVSQNPLGPGISAALYRSDDDGATWSSVLDFPNPGGTGVTVITGLAYDPANPDRVYVGISGPDHGVQTSDDGGQTWTVVGQEDIGNVREVLLGIDGLNLYAATDSGLWVLSL